MHCPHNNCNGELQHHENPKRENTILFKCSNCKCVFGLVDAHKEVGCPSFKETKSRFGSKLKSAKKVIE